MSSFSALNGIIHNVMLALLPIAGAMLIFYSVYQLWKDVRGTDRKKIRERLKDDEARRQAKRIEQSIRKMNASDKSPLENILNKLSLTQKVDKWIEQANVSFSATKFLMNVALATVGVFIIGLFLKFSIWVVLGAGLAVAFMPLWVLKFMAQRRMATLINQLPDVFELVSQALRAGHSLASGIQLIGKQLPDPAGTEFARIFHEQNLGIKIEEALTHFADRTDQLDIRFFVTAVLIQRQTGGDLAEILDKISEVIRDRIKILGQVKALTAEGRMSGWVLGIMPFFVFILAWMMNPDYANILLYEKTGQFMLGTAIFFEIIGVLCIKKIVNIKV
jgi:tight adherence protein B